MRLTARDMRMYALCGIEGILVAAATTAAFWVRFPPSEAAVNLVRLWWLVPLSVTACMTTFWFLGLYKGVWYYFGVREALRLAAATVLSAVLLAAVTLPAGRHSFPGTLLAVDWLLVTVVVGVERLSIRLIREGEIGLLRNGNRHRNSRRRVLIVGAGNAAESMVREMDKGTSFQAVGCVDDDARKLGRMVHQTPVLGTVDDIPGIVRRYNIEEIVIAIPSASASAMQRIVRQCQSSEVRFRTLPSLKEVIDGNVSISHLREVSIEDLLGREENHLDLGHTCLYLKGESVLVTGAGGSIGSELCRQIAPLKPGLIILFDWAENSIYEIDLEMRRRFPAVRVEAVIGSIRDAAKVNQVMEHYRPGTVFHAAAHKHVPLMEVNPDEAVLNNALGTRVLADAAEKYGVHRFVFVSTDKAVSPSSVMGATKRLGEMMLQERNSSNKTRFMIVRFGNVLGSNGSVVPLFKKQIAEGRPITVTHPQMTRYFMTISEAAQLIVRASAMGMGGEVFILDMGKPVRVVDLAREMARLSGLNERDVEIRYIGIRPGEKLHEGLLAAGEELVSTYEKKISIARPLAASTSGLAKGLDGLIELAVKRDKVGVKSKLRELVPSYQPQESYEVSEAILPSSAHSADAKMTGSPKVDEPRKAATSNRPEFTAG